MDCLMVFFFTTNYCYKGCDHCYNPSHPDKMSLATADKAIEWLKNVCIEEKVKSLRGSFLGGEPLIYPELPLYITDKIISDIEPITPRTPWGFAVHTNGDLLTDKYLRECKQRQLKVTINPTYDSLEVVEKKILQVKEICGGCLLFVVLNDVNMPRAEQLAELVVKHRCNIRINRLYDGGRNPAYIAEYTKRMKNVLNIFLNAPKPIYPEWLVESTAPLWEGPKNCYSCGRWLVIIDVDGTLRSCNPDMDTVIGHIDYTHWKDIKFPQRWSAKNLPECQGCEWITLCQGGCPYTRKLTYGTYDKKSPFCESFKELFPILMQLKTRWVNRHVEC